MTRAGTGTPTIQLALVATGGFAGAVCRWGVTLALPTTFPWGTLVVNVAGSLVLGMLVANGALDDRIPDWGRLVFGTGFISSFTTYSTFALETTTLGPALGSVNIVANYGLGIGAALVGRYLAGGTR